MKPKPGFLHKLSKLGQKTDNVTEEEIMSMVNEGHEQGLLEATEAEMITNIFEFGDKEAKDIMMHRKNIVAVNGNMTLDEASKFILDESHSRFPVYVDDIDNIIGIIYLKDAMIYKEKEFMGDKLVKDIPGLLRKACFIPETRNVIDLFKEMQSKKIHMEIVIDEYGQTAGLVAMEDILEEIVGNILDEYDEEETNIVRIRQNVYNINGMTTLEEIEDELSISFDEEDYDTLNGYLISKLDRIPLENEKPCIDIDNYHYKVLNVNNKIISLVQVTIDPKPDEDENKND